MAKGEFQMNRKAIAILSITAACILSAGTAAAFSSLHEQRQREFSSAAESTASAPAYWLREYEGKLAVFEEGTPQPVQIIDLDVRTLPPYDQGLLQAGIAADSRQELSRLLEDYTS